MSGLVRCSWCVVLVAGLTWYDAKGVRADEEAAANYVQLALQHEAHGRRDIRQELLEAALLTAPDYAPAHWHLGHVRLQGEWVPVAEAQRRAENDPALATYQDLRDEALGAPRQALALARWCQKEKWQDRADLHYAGIVLDPSADPRTRNDAMRRLNLVAINGNLLTQEEVERAQKTAARVEAAMKKWRGPLERLRRTIEAEGSPGKKLAEDELAGIDDSGVIPVLESFLLESGAVFGERIVELLGSFGQHDSTLALLSFAVRSPWENVRHAAIEHLKRRPMHEYVPVLLDGLTAPVQSQFLITRSPQGLVHYRHAFYRRNAQGNLLAAREHVARPILFSVAQARARNLTPLEAQLETQAKAAFEVLLAKLEAAQREQAMARMNASVFNNNEPILIALQKTTGQKLGTQPADWQEWWQGYNEVLTEKPNYYEYYPTQSTFIGFYQPPVRTGSCFAAGTPVWTESGVVPLETVKPGDRVLSQNLDTGELAYKLVLRTTARPPTSATVNVTLEDDPIAMTRAHVVVEAVQFVPGLQLLGHPPALVVHEPLPPELEVYNLVVADFNTFLVGERGVLVHDITYMNYRKPTRAVVPGLVWK